MCLSIRRWQLMTGTRAENTAMMTLYGNYWEYMELYVKDKIIQNTRFRFEGIPELNPCYRFVIFNMGCILVPLSCTTMHYSTVDFGTLLYVLKASNTPLSAPLTS